MDQDLKKAYDELKNDVDWVHTKWVIFMQLFGESEERIEFLNSMVPVFFLTIQFSLINDILISIGRLTDPKQTMRFNNLSLERMISYINIEQHPDLVESINTKYDLLMERCAEIRKQRDKRLAHTDENIRYGEGTIPIVDRKIIEEALKTIRELMNLLEEYFHGSHRAYDMPILKGDGNTIVHLLELANEHKKCVRKQ